MSIYILTEQIPTFPSGPARGAKHLSNHTYSRCKNQNRSGRIWHTKSNTFWVTSSFAVMIQASRSARRGAKQLSGCAKEWCAVVKVHDCRKIAAFRFDWKRGEATFPMCQRTVGRRGSPRLLEEVQSNIPAGPEEVQSNCRLH